MTGPVPPDWTVPKYSIWSFAPWTLGVAMVTLTVTDGLFVATAWVSVIVLPETVKSTFWIKSKMRVPS